MPQACIARWGNSMALRIPKQVLDTAGWNEGDNMEFAVKDDVVTIRRKRMIKKYSLSEALGSFRNSEDANFDWGAPIGREAL